MSRALANTPTEYAADAFRSEIIVDIKIVQWYKRFQHMKLVAGCQVALLVAAMAAGQETAVQSRVNDVHSLIWNNYIQLENGLLLTRLDMRGRPYYQPGLRESPSLEDTSLYGGMYLDAMVARYTVTGGAGAAMRARTLLRGLLRNATVSPSRGLLARGTHPDGSTYWGEPSADQYTGVVFGLWRYYRSTLATQEEKAEIRAVFTAFLERLEKDNWTVRNEEGKPTRFGDLGALVPTRAERLLAILLAAADVTGNQHWREVYEREKKSRLPLCKAYTAKKGEPWVQVQNAMALRMLLDLATHAGDRDVFTEGARTVAEACVPFLENYRKIMRPDGRFMIRREMARAGEWGERPLTASVRNPFDSVAVILILERREHYERALNTYVEMVRGLDFTELRYAGFIFPGEYNYWLAVMRKQLTYNPALDGETREETYRILLQDVYEGPGTVSPR